jgi:RNA polymerase sigma-70 factor (ECF subfamily)
MTEADYRQLVVTQRDRLHTYAAWWLGDLEAAGDVSQEAFLRLWQNHPSVHPAAGRSWLFRAAHRLCVDRHRVRAARMEVSLDSLVDGPLDDRNGLDDGRRAAELRRVLAEGLARLSAADRAVLVLREVLGLPIAEIGGVLERRAGNVKVALHRARERLRRELLKVSREYEP